MRYIALFKGINVGGKNIVKMADLRQWLFDLGLEQVKTYIQSGNAAFETAEDAETLAEKMQSEFAMRFGFESAIFIRNRDEISAVVQQMPYTPMELAEAEAANPKVEHLYVYFLKDSPVQETVRMLCGTGYTDKLRVGKRELYLLCAQSIRDSKLAAAIAKTWSVATARNWKTTQKLYDMAQLAHLVE